MFLIKKMVHFFGIQHILKAFVLPDWTFSSCEPRDGTFHSFPFHHDMKRFQKTVRSSRHPVRTEGLGHELSAADEHGWERTNVEAVNGTESTGLHMY